MLKLTYTETGFYLEILPQFIEDWVTARIILALRVGQKIYVEPSTASFLLPADLPGIELLKTQVQREGSQIIALDICDAEYIEVSLFGTWVTSNAEGDEGVFVTVMSDRTEFFLFKLWQEAQSCTSSLR